LLTQIPRSDAFYSILSFIFQSFYREEMQKMICSFRFDTTSADQFIPSFLKHNEIYVSQQCIAV